MDWHNRSENRYAGALDVFQRFDQCLLVTGIQLNVISGAVRFQADGFTDYECDRLRFGFADALRRLAASFLAVHERVRRLVRQGGKFLAGSLAGQKHDLSRRALPLRGIDRVRILNLNATLSNELLQSIRITCRVALGGAEFRKRLTVRVGHIEYIDRAKSHYTLFILVRGVGLCIFPLRQDECENQDSLRTFLYKTP